MTKSWQGLVALGVVVGMSGCARVQTRVVELPRVDQEVSGNQGYLQGKETGTQPPRRTTRQVLMTDVELMTHQEVKQGLRNVVQMSTTPVKGELGPGGRGWRVPDAPAPKAPTPEPSAPLAPVTPPAPAPSVGEAELSESPTPVAPRVAPPAVSATPTTYTVQKGDTLEKIAKKVYGDTKRWPKIYKANREAIKNPNKLYPGQRLTIPALPGDDTESRTAP